MVGLPGSGKTQWAQKHSQENRDKRYNILGTERVLHQLRVSRKRVNGVWGVLWGLGGLWGLCPVPAQGQDSRDLWDLWGLGDLCPAAVQGQQGKKMGIQGGTENDGIDKIG